MLIYKLLIIGKVDIYNIQQHGWNMRNYKGNKSVTEKHKTARSHLDEVSKVVKNPRSR